jgi:hypothetical protein
LNAMNIYDTFDRDKQDDNYLMQLIYQAHIECWFVCIKINCNVEMRERECTTGMTY